MGGRRWWILAALVVALLPIAVDLPLLVVAIPAVSSGLATSPARVAQAVAVVPVGLGLLLPAAGAWGRRRAPRTVAAAGLLLCLGGQLVELTAGGIGVLAAGRLAVAAGGALALPAALRVVTAVFEPAEHPRAVAVWAGFTGFAVAAAPVVGGAAVDGFGWRAAVGPQLLLLVVGLLVLLVLVPRPTATEPAAASGAPEVVAPMVLFALMGALVALSSRLAADEPGRAVVGGVAVTVVLAAFAIGARATVHLLDQYPRPAVAGLGGGSCGVALLALAATDRPAGLLLAVPLGAGAAVVVGTAARAEPLLRLVGAGAGVAVLGSLRPTAAFALAGAVALLAAGVGVLGGRRELPPA